MCTVCGCGNNGSVHTHTHEHPCECGHAHAHEHPHVHDHEHPHTHDHHHEHDHAHDHDHPHHHHHHEHADAEGVLHYGRGPAAASVPGLDQGRILRIERDVLEHNRGYAQANRARFARERILALNLMSSPGAGKTTLLTRTIATLRDRLPLGVIEGDQQTSMDAERIRAAGAMAIQVNTGKGCHLDARMVGEAHAQLNLAPGGLLLIENVGNLVCPALWDLGEAARVVMLSVTEGEDKPLKYPDMFAVADLLLITKIDLAPHLDFDLQSCLDNARRIRPGLETLCVSARSGEGLPAWIDWIEAARQRQAAPSAEAELEAMRARVAALETELAHLRGT